MARKNRIQISHYWPDRVRTRLRVDNEDKAEELLLRVKLAEIDGTWPGLRAALVGGKGDDAVSLARSPFELVADRYLNDHVMVHNKSFASKRSFLKRFKERWGTQSRFARSS